MKNYYEILEVDKEASAEVIEKAYKVLAKKYHPDLQQGASKIESAEKMKIINQAYDVLSDNEKRQEYDKKLEYEKSQREWNLQKEQERIIKENELLKQQLYQNRNNVETSNSNMQDRGTINNMNRVLNESIKAAQQQAYYDAYIQDMQNRGYKIKYKHGIKYYVKLVIALIIVGIILWGICQIPIVKNYLAQMYEENIFFRAIVNIFKNTFNTII